MQSKHLSGIIVTILFGVFAHTAFAASSTSSVMGDVPSGHYVVEKDHAYITFSYSHLGFSTPHIAFDDFDVDLQLDADNPQNSTLKVTIDANSIQSQVDEFDEHLVGERFFDTAKYPLITFTSSSVVMDGSDTAAITGDLTIKGQTHSVKLDTKLNKAGTHPMLKKPVAGFNAEAKVLRSAWDLGYGIPMVGDEITLYISVELQKSE